MIYSGNEVWVWDLIMVPQRSRSMWCRKKMRILQVSATVHFLARAGRELKELMAV
jgi:hypothetical protein